MTYRLHAVVLLALLALPATPARAQEKLSPSDTVRAFYTLLRQQHYTEGFAHSVYAGAVEGLSPADLAELAPDFQQMAATIPGEIDIKGEQISGNVATVFTDLPEQDGQVGLVKDGGRWLVGDRESLEIVQREKAAFFFNARIGVNHDEVFKLLKLIMSAEDFHMELAKKYATVDELVAAGRLPDDVKGGATNGYRFIITLGPKSSTYAVTAVPERYGRTGKLSFYADPKGVRAADNKGLSVGPEAPALLDLAGAEGGGGAD